MKKTLLSTLSAVFVIALIVFMTSCNQGGGSNDPTNPIVPGIAQNVNQALPASVLAYFDAHNVTVNGGLDTPIMNSSPDFCGGPGDNGNPPPPDGGGPKGGGPDGSGSDGTGTVGSGPDCTGHNPPPPPHGGVGQPIDNHGGFEFLRIMWQLKLTKDQFPVVQKVMWNYQQCVQTVLAKTYAARKEIMYAAQQQQKVIMDTYKAALKAAGKDKAAIQAARKAAMDAMKALNDDTKTKLDALIDKGALCDCWNTMITDFEAALTPEQLTLFQTWLAKQKTPCASTVGS
jgi:hypothetical protein